MATTTYGTPYVQNTDLVSGWPGSSLNVATRVDAVSYSGNGINAQTGTTYTLVLTDAGKNVTLSNASSVTVTIPAASSVAYATGTVIGFTNLGAGVVTIAAAGGVTLNGTTLTIAQYSRSSIMKIATDTWVLTSGGGIPKASVSAYTGSPTIDTTSRPGKTIYKFTGSGSLTVGTAGTCEVLVVGGGGSGGDRTGGGGGAGGLLYSTSAYLDAGSQTITVGGGGAAVSINRGIQGNTSSVGTSYYGVGGGGGGAGASDGYAVGLIGGSGGGGGGASATGSATAGTGVTGQGYAGGNGISASTGGRGGGGGGASAVGTAASTNGGAGASGLAVSITGVSVTYAGGGGGGPGNGAGGAGGTGGGGAGGTSAGSTATSGTANTGGGGGGSGSYGATTATSGAGGSGYVVVVIG